MREIIMVLILVILVFCTYNLIMSGITIGSVQVYSYSEIEEKSEELRNNERELEEKSTTEFEQRKTYLQTAITNYNKYKEEYEEIMERSGGEAHVIASAEIYDMGYLWTTIGGYASSQDLTLQIDVYKSNFVDTQNVQTGDMSYVICDVEFTVLGKYESMYKFISSIEENDKLGFEIRNCVVENNPLRPEKPAIPEKPEGELEKSYLEALKKHNDYERPLKCKFKIIKVPIDRTTLVKATPSINIEDLKPPKIEIEQKSSGFEGTNKQATETP